MKAEKSQGKKLKALGGSKNLLEIRLSELRLPEIIMPKFSIDSKDVPNRILVQISAGSIGYFLGEPLVKDIYITVSSHDRLVICGNNGSGKSTLIKAIFGDEKIYKGGEWNIINKEDIGYLDQHYNNLIQDKSVFETISELIPHWSPEEVRRHLNIFLFRKNEEVSSCVSTLSGGEKARLSLAQIAAKTPKLLLLDEITNNLDLETKDHVAQVLKKYLGAIIIISHDSDFLKDIGIDENFAFNLSRTD